MTNVPKSNCFGRVAVLMGGPHSEREVSLMSGNAVLDALLSAGVDAYGIDVDHSLLKKLLAEKPDRIFLAMHGTYGEDGTIQGMLESLNIPYTGSSVLASALAMDKVKTKLIWQASNIPTLPFYLADEKTTASQVEAEFSFPWAVKPISEGSSVGVSRVNQAQEFTLALENALKSSREIMIEPWIDGSELTVGIVGQKVLPTIRIETPVGFYDYHAKYFSDETRFLLETGLSSGKDQELKTLALKAYSVLGCRHWGRVDAVMDKAGKIWFLEVNTIPGLTPHSLVPQAAAATGMDFQTLILTILAQTLKK